MNLTDKPVTNFLDELASNAPAPGGGSVAALTGALGAALISMVCNLTLGKKAYADVEEDILEIRSQSEALRARLTGLIEEDVKAYTGYSQVAKMPRDTEEEKAARAEAMLAALKVATDVPLAIAIVASLGPGLRNAMIPILTTSGIAFGYLMAGNVLVERIFAWPGIGQYAWTALTTKDFEALRGFILVVAVIYVLINLGTLKDEEFVADRQAKLDALLEGKGKMRDEIYDLVVSKL